MGRSGLGRSRAPRLVHCQPERDADGWVDDADGDGDDDADGCGGGDGDGGGGGDADGECG